MSYLYLWYCHGEYEDVPNSEQIQVLKTINRSSSMSDKRIYSASDSGGSSETGKPGTGGSKYPLGAIG